MCVSRLEKTIIGHEEKKSVFPVEILFDTCGKDVNIYIEEMLYRFRPLVCVWGRMLGLQRPKDAENNDKRYWAKF